MKSSVWVAAALVMNGSVAVGAPEQGPTPRSFVTTHTASFGGASLTYTATAADTFLTDEHGAPKAALFSFSYVRQAVKDASQRPVLFIFNGGPGSASLWIHMGALGPRRIVSSDDAARPTLVAPFQVTDNPLSPLDIADLVFIDPVGTGFSHVLGNTKPDEFYSVESDAKETVDFITAWLTKNHRWNSPKYLLGESYGTTRAAVVAKALQGGPFGGGNLPAVSLNGVVLLGVSLGAPGAEASHQLLLPSLAATAWYHGKVDRGNRTFAAFISEVRQYAATEYGAALFAGNTLSKEQQQAVAAKLGSYTGLSQAFILDHNLRLSSADFAGEVLRAQDKDVGKYDGRYLLPHDRGPADPVADDPAMAQYTPAYVAAFNDYMQKDLGITVDQRYETIAFSAVNFHWNWGQGGASALRADDLAAAMRRNTSMRLLVGSGYYDLVTPFAEAQYMIDHAPVPSERVTYKNYEAGHMVYLGMQGTKAFTADLRAFLHP